MAHPHAHTQRVYAVRRVTDESVYGKRKSTPSRYLSPTSFSVTRRFRAPTPTSLPPSSVLVTATCTKRAVVESSCHRLCPVTHRAPFYQEGEHTGQTYLSQQ